MFFGDTSSSMKRMSFLPAGSSVVNVGSGSSGKLPGLMPTTPQ